VALKQSSRRITLLSNFTKKTAESSTTETEAPFFTALVNYTERRADTFHCPGHSGGQAFLKAPVGLKFREFFGENLLRADICNAVEEMGQLLDHTGAAYEAEKNAARIFGADHLFFVTNGTSTSNKIVWHSQVGPNDIVVVDRNCHKSNLHAIMMTGATPVFLMPTRNHHGIIGPIPASEFSPETIRAKIAMHPFIKNKRRKPRIFTLTQSTYDGVLYNTTRLKQMLDGVVENLHFDEAWLPHATFHPIYKDMHAIGGRRTRHSLVFSTQSTHKTLAGLSQASQVLVQEAEERKLNRVLFNEAYLMHTSTSPQYSIIASCDVAAAMMDKGRGEKIVGEALEEAFAFRAELRSSNLPFTAWEPPQEAFNVRDHVHEHDQVQREQEREQEHELEHERVRSNMCQAAWLLEPNAAWHGFGAVEEGFNMLDPLKVTILNPGLEMDGSFSAEGIPAQIVTKYLCDNGVIVEKCGLYSFFIMFTIGITRERWQTLLAKLHAFKNDYDTNGTLKDVMPAFVKHHPNYADKGLKDLCQEIHATYKAHDVARMTTEMYTSPLVPAMRPSDAFAKMAHEEIERVSIDDLEGKVTAVMLTPYPPGIPLLVPGEIVNASIVRYLKFARAFNEKFPGFETDVHGLVRENGNYAVDCVRVKKRKQHRQKFTSLPRFSGGRRTSKPERLN
jgi:arginine decarboxylase